MELTKLRDWLINGCATADIPLSSSQTEELLQFAKFVLEVNQTMNLTRITSPEDFAIKHFVDCLLISKVGVDFGLPGIDIGSGAGFPGIVIASYFKPKSITLLDSLEKRTKFLQCVVDDLHLDSVEVLHARAEDAGRDQVYREKFAWATARAVAPLTVLLEYCSPFIAIGGHLVAMKGSNVDEEIAEAQVALKRLKLEIVETKRYELPFDMGERTIVAFRKRSKLSKEYPRKAGIPTKKPLKS